MASGNGKRDEMVAEVIVVGGGPAGASTAHALARAGVDVLVLDRARFPRDKACSEYLSPQASRLLDAMGALEQVESAGAARLGGMKVFAPGGAVIHGEFAHGDQAAAHGYRGYRDHGLALRRTVLDAILLDRARVAGAEVREGVKVTDLLYDAAGRVAGVQTDSGELRARLVVGADGLRSVVARRLGLARVARRPRRVALVTHVRGLAGMSDVGEMHVDAEGYTGLARVGADEVNVAVVVPASRARDMHGDPGAFLRAWIARRPALAQRFAGSDETSGVIATGPFASRARRAWAPGAALVGDSADFFDPFTGEGIYAALRGGEILATYAFDALRAPSPHLADVPLAAYDRWRRHEFGGKWMVERLVAAAVAWPPLLDRAAERLARRKDLADLLVGVTGDFVPAREVLRPGFIAALLFASGAADAPPSTTDSRTTTRHPARVRSL